MVKNIISGFFTRGMVAIVNLGILLMMSRYMGSGAVGQMSLIILNLAIVNTICEIYSGSALVFFIPKTNLSKVYNTGIAWIFLCTLLVNAGFYLAGAGLKEFWLHVLLLSFISALHSFNNVIILAKEKIALYNFLVLFQPLVLILVLIVMIFSMEVKSIDSYVIALYVSWSASLIISAISVIGTKKTSVISENLPLKEIFTNGTVNQLGNLAHTLSNRYNYYILEITSLALVGIYASGSSLIEQSLWMISASVSPLVLTHIANQRDPENNVSLTLHLARICFGISGLCVIILYFIPADFFSWLFGGKDFSGIKTIMLYLSPGVICISFSSIISHYFSGLGKQKILLAANCTGLVITLATAYFFIQKFGLKGACYSATMAYAAQSLVLVVVFMRLNKLGIPELFGFKKTVA